VDYDVILWDDLLSSSLDLEEIDLAFLERTESEA